MALPLLERWFMDRPVSIGRWPGVSMHWTPAGRERLELWICWKLETQAESDARPTWAGLTSHLHDGTEWRVRSPLGITDRPLTDEERQSLIAFARSVEHALASGADTVPPIRLSLATDPLLRTDACFELVVSLHAARNEKSDVSDVTPDPALNRTQLAQHLTSDFAGLELAHTANAECRPYGVARDVFAITIVDSPTFFALPPFRREPFSGRVEVGTLDSPDTTEITVSVDADTCLDELLDDLDAACALPVRNAADPAPDATWLHEQLVRAKSKLARALSRRVCSVQKDEPAADLAPLAADVFLECVARDLKAARSIGAVVVMPRAPDGAGRSGLTLRGTVCDRAAGFTGVARLARRPSASDGSSVLLFASQRSSDDVAVTFEPELAITEVVAANRVPDSGENPITLTLHEPHIVALPSVCVPLPARECPEPPTLRSQASSTEPLSSTDNWLERVLEWRYSFEYTRRNDRRDVVSYFVDDDLAPGEASLRPSECVDADPLVASLVNYRWNRAAVANALVQLRQGSAAESVDGALAFLALVATDVAAIVTGERAASNTLPVGDDGLAESLWTTIIDTPLAPCSAYSADNQKAPGVRVERIDVTTGTPLGAQTVAEATPLVARRVTVDRSLRESCSARAVLRLERNARLGAVTAADVFVYRSVVTFPGPVFPSRVVTEECRWRDVAPTGSAGARLETLLCRLADEIPASTAITVSVWYEGPWAAAGGSPTRVPVLMRTAVADAEAIRNSGIAAALDEWQRGHEVSGDEFIAQIALSVSPQRDHDAAPILFLQRVRV